MFVCKQQPSATSYPLPALSLDDCLYASLLANFMIEHVQVKLLARHDGVPRHAA